MNDYVPMFYLDPAGIPNRTLDYVIDNNTGQPIRGLGNESNVPLFLLIGVVILLMVD